MWLIGQVISEFPKSKLPSKKEVLALLQYNIKNVNNTNIAAKIVADLLINVWEMCQIPIHKKWFIIKKIFLLHNSWKKLTKNRNNKKRQSLKIRENQEKFECNIQNLFDIAAKNAIQEIKKEGIKNFLIDQRKPGRQSCIKNIRHIIKHIKPTFL